MAIIFDATLDGGDFGEFDSATVVNASAAFIDGLRGSTKALQATVNSANAEAWGLKTIALGSPILRFGYLLRDTGVYSNTGDTISYCAGMIGSTGRFYQDHWYPPGSSESTIAFYARNDSGTFIGTNAYTYERGEHSFEYRLQRATGAASADGQMQVFVDGILRKEVLNLQLSTLSTPTHLRFGLGTISKGDSILPSVILDRCIVRNDDIPIFGKSESTFLTYLRRRRRD